MSAGAQPDGAARRGRPDLRRGARPVAARRRGRRGGYGRRRLPHDRALGWRTVVIDPRSAFATAERMPSADEIVVKWPEEGYDGDRVAARGSHRRADARPEARRSGHLRCAAARRGYVGALGIRQTQDKRRDRLRESGIRRPISRASPGRSASTSVRTRRRRRPSRSWPRSSRSAPAATAGACATPRAASTWSTRPRRLRRPSPRASADQPLTSRCRWRLPLRSIT